MTIKRLSRGYRYAKEFKLQVVQSILAGQMSADKAKRVHEISGKMTVYRWLRQYEENPLCWDKIPRSVKRKEPSKSSQRLGSTEIPTDLTECQKALARALDKILLLEKIEEIRQRESKFNQVKKSKAKRS